MVRIVTPEHPASTQEIVGGGKLIGRWVAEEPAEAKDFLVSFGLFPAKKEASTEELIEAIVEGLSMGNKVYGKVLSDYLTAFIEDHLNFNQGQGGQGGGFGGMISSAISSLGNAAKGIKGRKRLRQEASNEAIRSLIKQKEAQTVGQTPPRSGSNSLQILGIFALLGVALFFGGKALVKHLEGKGEPST